ncbi:MAG TPA: HDOD domain-containing protein [Planctomycetota bacterium]|nr:HDOD domain-containing protein [Planctomycetota bacterium]
MAEASGTVQVHERVRKLVERVQGLPTLPSMLNNINQMILNPKTSAKEVAQVISSDPALTSKVLRVVNSSFYGFPNRITTITHAIVILGFNTIKSIVLSSTIFDVFRRTVKPGDFDRTEFWKHSIGCGAAAKVIGRRLNYPMLEELFIAGLLHDVGKIVLDQFIPDKFVEVLNLVRSRDILIAEAEAQILGATHADVGAWLFEKWNLSKGLVETTRCHHNPALASDSPKFAEIIHVSDILVRAIRFGNGGDNKIPALQEGAWKSLGLQESELDDLLSQTGQEIEKAMIFLDFIK